MATDIRNPQWLRGGAKFFPEMLAAIRGARQSVELETYIFSGDETGRRFLDALIVAAKSGARVRLLADSFGSISLPQDFFQPLIQAGGEVRFFNPLRFSRFGVRDHRKLLVCDARTIFAGGANISKEYDGDGITQGWFDFMVGFEDAGLALLLRGEFEQMFSDAGFEYGRLRRLRAFRKIRRRTQGTGMFAVVPGRGTGSFQHALQQELASAKTADIIAPYFLPPRAVVGLLRQIAGRGGRVRLILPGRCDVPVAQAAGLVYYERLLKGGVEIYEYQPQILHAKLFIVDDDVFAGSSNLDVRSLRLNYELMLQFTDRESAVAAREIFEGALAHCRRIHLESFRASQNFLGRLENRWAHFLLKQIDPLVALRQISS
jgi:cardiolipin synthase